ncbi:MAG: guanylate kinase [Rhodobacteraceae bacterium]|nr:guanylate kinase [Paracoccaceae bacterium]
MSNSQKINEKGLLIILSSPSGAGKSTLAKRIRAWDKNCVFSISATTRKPREGEEDGKDYYFISEEEFNSKVSKNEMLEHAKVFGNLYGSPMSPVLSSINNGNDVLFDVDWQGSQQIKNSSLGKYVLSIFILPPSIDELESRLKLRNQDSDEVISNRMAKSVEEISHWPEYDYVVVNDEINNTEEKLKTIITAERLRLSQQPGMVEFVRSLNSGFGDR